jgi:hypothetical protein
MVEGHEFQIEIYRLEVDPTWTLEVVDEDGTSTVWDDTFDSDQAAMDELMRTIKKEGLSAFRDSGNVIKFPKRWLVGYLTCLGASITKHQDYNLQRWAVVLHRGWGAGRRVATLQPMIQYIDIYRSAKLLIDQHGGEAEIFAAMQADECLERGDPNA